jgi:two-component system, NarL family, response regulator DevR
MALENDRPIRVLVADDFEPIRSAVKKFLRDFKQLVVVGEASNYREMMDGIVALKPDVVLFDLRMPGETSINLLTLREKLAEPRPALICMSIWTNEESAKFTGAFGCPLIDKADLGTQLVPAIEAAVNRAS